MPYTLVKGLAWVVLALLVGGVIGWLLRNLTSRRQIARARTAAGAASPDVTLAAEAELERLQIRLAELEPIVVERDRLRAELDSVRHGQASTDRSLGATRAGLPVALEPPPNPDVASATAVLGRAIALDDLRVVVGISPAIESLCHGIGIRTWWDLATIETSLLRTMLRDAGASFAAADPSSWPEQATLLSEGRWTEFKALAETVASD